MLLTTFTNKVGSIGLSLIAILLVERRVSTGEGALVLSALKTTMLAGTLAGGALTDRFSARSLVLTALLLSAAGLGLLPFQASIWAILACGMAAQFAEALMNVTQRLLLMDEVERSQQREALAWMRMVNNLAQIFSFSVAALSARLGLTALFLFDAATSFGAFLLGRGVLPRREAAATERGSLADAGAGSGSRWTYFRCAFVLMCWSFFYELFLEGGAGRLEILHPGQGLRRFSLMMILNTVLCAAFALKAVSLFKKPFLAIAGGMALSVLGILVAGWGMASQLWVFGGMLLLTLGELMVGSTAQYTLMRLTPPGRKSGFYYSLGISLMQAGRLLGAAVAFPLLIHASRLGPFTALILGVFGLQLAVLWSLRGEIGRLA